MIPLTTPTLCTATAPISFAAQWAKFTKKVPDFFKVFGTQLPPKISPNENIRIMEYRLVRLFE